MTGLSVNLRTGAATQLASFDVLAASGSLMVNDSGVYTFQTTSRDQLPWSFALPLIDFGQVVSLRYVEILGEFSGPFTLSVMDDHERGNSYRVTPTSRAQRQERIKVAMGSGWHRAQYHTFRFSGKYDFSLDGLLVQTISLGRRVSG